MGWPASAGWKLEGRGEPASACAVMSHKAHGVSVLHERILAGDPFVDGDEHLLFSQELQHVAKATALSLNHLSYAERGRDLTSQISLAISRLKLAHQRNRNHVVWILSVNRHSVLILVQRRAGEIDSPGSSD